jgi:putative ABC transport system permease protein
VKVRDLGELAFRNLREAVLRNTLTTLGVAVGVASLVAMLSLGVGLQQLASKRLSGTGLFDTVYVMSRTNLRAFGRAATGAAETGQKRSLLDEAARSEIAKLPGVAETYPQIRIPTEAAFDGTSYATIVAGVPASSQNTGAFEGIEGAFFSSSSADEAILQIELAKVLSNDPASLIGKTVVLRYAERQAILDSPDERAGNDKSGNAATSEGFSIVPREKSLRIVGIVDSEPAAGFGGIGSGRVLIPQAVAESLRATQANDLRDLVRGSSVTTYTSLTVRAVRPTDVAAIESAIKNMGFFTFSLLDATKNLRLFFAVFDSLLAIFGSLALAVATLGIVNTLVMAILERRREIGVLKALGASDGDVKEIFLAEAGAMGLAGGILGVGFGWLIGRVVTLGTNFYLRRQQLPPAHVFYVPGWLVAGAIVFAVIVSLAAGLYPASRAARLSPVEALRYE